MNFIFDSAVITMYVSILYCLIAAFGAVSGKLQPICQPSNSSHGASPKLPTLPTAFSTLVEVNIVNENYSALFKEYYDQEADKGRIEQTKDGQTYMDIYDYALDEVLHVNLSSKTCTVTLLLTLKRAIFTSAFLALALARISKACLSCSSLEVSITKLTWVFPLCVE